MSVAIIGAGRVGTALGIALRRAGYAIDFVVAKHAQTAKRAAQSIGKTTGLSDEQFRRFARRDGFRSSLIIVATPDDAIETVARELAELGRDDPRNSAARRVVLHTSGALSSAVLEALRGAGFAIGSLHPLVSISDPRVGAKALSQAFFSIEGDAAAIRLGKKLVRALGAQSFTIDTNMKPLYHAAALMSSPNLTALFDIAVEMLARCGLSRTRARLVLLPLVKSTVENLTTHDPARALTGTFKRGDIATVRKHLAAIESQDLRDALAAYRLLGRRSLTLSKNPPNEKAIRELLKAASDKN